MSLSRRSRREWRIVLWFMLASSVISAYFGFAVRLAGDTPLTGITQGLLASLLIATPIVIVEVRRSRFVSLPWLRRLPLAGFFAVKVLFYFVVIINGLILSRWLMSGIDKHPIVFDANFRNSLFFAIGMSLFGSLISETGRLLGFGTLKSLLIGRYVQPQREQKVFLLIDMNNSTGLAEQLGPVRFHELLNMFFRDIAEAALDCEAEIHKYVGDEAILTWPVSAGPAGAKPASPVLIDGDCLACPFLARDFIAARGEQYRAQFGAIPGFRAALHCGEIVAGEIGDQRREIAYVGDTLNVAARLLDAAKELGHDMLVSDDLLAQAPLPPGLRTIRLPTLTVRGRTAPLGVSALEST
jgi:adenylate cyclase